MQKSNFEERKVRQKAYEESEREMKESVKRIESALSSLNERTFFIEKKVNTMIREHGQIVTNGPRLETTSKHPSNNYHTPE